MTATDMALTGESRVFFADGLAGPATEPAYKGLARSGGLTWDNGTLTPVRIPSANRFDQFDIVEVIQGQQDLPQLPIMFRYPRTRSELLELFRRRCPVDLEIHWGKCGRPDDYLEGWVKDGKIIMVDKAHPLNYTTDDLGTFDADGQAAPIETVNFTGLDLYEIVAIQPTEQAVNEITDPIIAVTICDAISCGSCGVPSDGCQTVFALTSGVTGSPGLPLEIIFTLDQGDSVPYLQTSVGSATLTEIGRDMACVGPNLLVVTDQLFHHYAPIVDVEKQDATAWTAVNSGYVALGKPRAIFSLDRERTWIAGENGTIYFSSDITDKVVAQTAGEIATETLNDIHGNEAIVVAVGDSNRVLVTESEGKAWSSIAGPTTGKDLTSVHVISELVWFVGNSEGILSFTLDGGQTWTPKFFGTASTAINDITFVNRRVGFLAQGATMFRTWNGGNNWVPEPQNPTFTFPTNTAINSIGVCGSDANLYFAGGAKSSDGILIRGVPVV